MRNKKLIILFSVLIAVTLLVVFNSVLFSVQHVEVHCINVKESQYTRQVKSAHRIKKGTSIFFVDKKKTIENIQKELGGAVRVIGVEKQFPNRISIDFIEVRPYVRVSDGYKTYYCDNEMRVMESGGTDKLINLKFNGSLPDLEPGDKLSFVSSGGLSAADIVTSVFDGLARLGYYDSVIELIDEIDLSGNFIILKISSGMKWEIVSADRIADKLRLALSVYENGLNDEQKTKGTLIIAGSDRLVANYRSD